MAHIEKYKRVQVGAMVRHYERTMDATLERANIDASRTRLNYEVGRDDEHVDMEEVIGRLAELHNEHGRALRSDAVVMADLVVTMPKGFPEGRAEEFFCSAFDFATDFWGRAVVVQGYVHMDESQPHMHLPIIPFDQEAQRFRACDIITRTRLRQMHGEMERYLCRELGMERVGVELTKQERGERELEYTGLKAYQEAKDELARVRQEASQQRDRAQHERSRADAYAASARTAEQELAKTRELVAATKGQAEQWEQARAASEAQAQAWDQAMAANKAAAEQEQQRLERLRQGCRDKEAEIGRIDEEIRAAEQQQPEQALQQGVGGGPEQAPERGLRGLVKLAQLEMGEGGGLEERERQEGARAGQLEEAERQEAERAEELGVQLGGVIERHGDAAEHLERLEERTREVDGAVAGLRERVEAALERLVERLRDLTHTMGLERVSERLNDVLDRVNPQEYAPGMNEAVARGLGDQDEADWLVPERYELGYEGPEPAYGYCYEEEQEIDHGWDRGWER